MAEIVGVYDPDSPPSVEAEPLGPRELDAKAFWQRFLPTLSKQLESQGPLALDRAIRAAWHRTEYHSLLAQARDPKLTDAEAWTRYRNEWLYPPPETPTTQA